MKKMSTDKTAMTKPAPSQEPQGKQLPDNYNSENIKSEHAGGQDDSAAWSRFKSWNSTKGPGGGKSSD